MSSGKLEAAPVGKEIQGGEVSTGTDIQDDEPAPKNRSRYYEGKTRTAREKSLEKAA